MYSIAFTGHRPEFLGGYDWSSPQNRRIGLAIKKTILNEMSSIDETDFTFYFGGALGADQMAFEVVKFIQERHPEYNITKVLCVPLKVQENRWPAESRQKYHEQMLSAEKVVYVDTLDDYKLGNIKPGVYHPAKMMARNRYMVDNCQTLIAIYNGRNTGGTFNCVQYAQKENKNIVVISPNFC